jgi:hypothetical protein
MGWQGQQCKKPAAVVTPAWKDFLQQLLSQ